jgi:hypothetical protein
VIGCLTTSKNENKNFDWNILAIKNLWFKDSDWKQPASLKKLIS